MSIYKQKGFNRLAKLIAIMSFFITYIILYVMSYNLDNEEVFVVFPIVSLLCSVGAFVFTRLVYWVIDGFKDSEDSKHISS